MSIFFLLPTQLSCNLHSQKPVFKVLKIPIHLHETSSVLLYFYLQILIFRLNDSDVVHFYLFLVKILGPVRLALVRFSPCFLKILIFVLILLNLIHFSPCTLKCLFWFLYF